jgi:hypothetical protein
MVPDRLRLGGVPSTPLAEEVQRRLHESAELHIAVEEDEAKLVLTGTVADEQERRRPSRSWGELAPRVVIEDNLELARATRRNHGHAGSLAAPAVGERVEQGDEPQSEADELEPGDFTAQDTVQFGDAAAGPTSAFEEDEASEGDEVFVPATDPVGTGREVVGGLQGGHRSGRAVEG